MVRDGGAREPFCRDIAAADESDMDLGTTLVEVFLRRRTDSVVEMCDSFIRAITHMLGGAPTSIILWKNRECMNLPALIRDGAAPEIDPRIVPALMAIHDQSNEGSVIRHGDWTAVPICPGLTHHDIGLENPVLVSPATRRFFAIGYVLVECAHHTAQCDLRVRDIEDATHVFARQLALSLEKWVHKLADDIVTSEVTGRFANRRLLHTICRRAAEVFSADSAYAMVFDPHRLSLDPAAAYGKAEPPAQSMLDFVGSESQRVPRGIARVVLEARSVYVSGDTSAEDDPMRPEFLWTPTPGASLSKIVIPVTLKRRPLGVFSIDSRARHAFDVIDLWALSRICRRGAEALDTALGARQVSVVARPETPATPDPPAVLRAACRNACQSLRVPAAAIWRGVKPEDAVCVSSCGITDVPPLSSLFSLASEDTDPRPSPLLAPIAVADSGILPPLRLALIAPMRSAVADKSVTVGWIGVFSCGSHDVARVLCTPDPISPFGPRDGTVLSLVGSRTAIALESAERLRRETVHRTALQAAIELFERRVTSGASQVPAWDDLDQYLPRLFPDRRTSAYHRVDHAFYQLVHAGTETTWRSVVPFEPTTQELDFGPCRVDVRSLVTAGWVEAAGSTSGVPSWCASIVRSDVTTDDVRLHGTDAPPGVIITELRSGSGTLADVECNDSIRMLRLVSAGYGAVHTATVLHERSSELAKRFNGDLPQMLTQLTRQHYYHLTRQLNHDARSFLRALVGELEDTLKGDRLPRRDADNLAELLNLGRRAWEGLEAVLTRLRGDPEVREFVDVKTIVSDGIDFAGGGIRGDGVRRRIRVQPRLVAVSGIRVLGSAPALTMVVYNIVTNAIKAVERRAASRSSSAQSYAPEVSVFAGLSPDKGSVWIDVEDNGDGIPAEAHQKIFEPYVHLVDGIGIGLAAAREVAADHLGSVTLIKSSVGVGSVFRLTLPLHGTPGAA